MVHSVEAIVGQVGEDSDAVRGCPASAAVFVNTRADIEAGRRLHVEAEHVVVGVAAELAGLDATLVDQVVGDADVIDRLQLVLAFPPRLPIPPAADD